MTVLPQLLLLTVTFLWSPTYEDLHDVVLVSVHDGDTIIVNLPKEKKLFGYHRGVRIAGIDTPELHDKRWWVRALAIYARNVVRDKLKKAKKIHLVDTGREKYDRILARVLADNLDIGAFLIRRGLAKPYDGGTKDQNW